MNIRKNLFSIRKIWGNEESEINLLFRLFSISLSQNSKQNSTHLQTILFKVKTPSLPPIVPDWHGDNLRLDCKGRKCIKKTFEKSPYTRFNIFIDAFIFEEKSLKETLFVENNLYIYFRLQHIFCDNIHLMPTENSRKVMLSKIHKTSETSQKCLIRTHSHYKILSQCFKKIMRDVCYRQHTSP